MAPRTAGSVLILGLAATLLVGCSAGSASSASGGASMAAPAPAVMGEGVGVAAGAGDSSKSVATTDRLVVGRAVVVRADLAVRVDDVPAATTRLAQVAASHHADIASQSTSDGAIPAPVLIPVDGDKTTDYCAQVGCGTSATSVTTLRVANSDVEPLLADVRRLGAVTWSQRSSDDVTAQVADVDARVTSAETSVVRLRTLMQRATSLTDVVTLEAELGRRQADLESLQAQQRALADQTALATVTVTLTSEVVAAPQESTGFLAGLAAGWDAFTAAVVGGLTVLGALVPFLLVLVPAGLLVLWIVRRRSSRRTGPTTAAAAPGGAEG